MNLKVISKKISFGKNDPLKLLEIELIKKIFLIKTKLKNRNKNK